MTGTITLTDRYVDAAMRTVPEDQRDDLSAELRASIDDQVDARVAEGEEHTSAERAVLTELGDPDKLAAQYTDRPLWLVGPRYFLDWWRLLKLLLAIVVPFAGLGVGIAQVIDGSGIGQTTAAIVTTMLSVAVHVAFWTTLIFAIVERTSPRSGKVPVEWSVDHLPEPRQKGVGFGDMIANVVFLFVAAGAIIWDLTIGFVPSEPGLSFLDPDLWPWWITGLLVFMAIEAALSVIVFLVGRWTIALAVVNAILDLAVAVPALWLLASGQLLNAEYFPTLIGDDGAQVAAIVTVIAGFGIVAITLWDIIDVAIKTSRSQRIGR